MIWFAGVFIVVYRKKTQRTGEHSLGLLIHMQHNLKAFAKEEDNMLN